MRRLLCLAALIIALGAIDWYAFHGRYRAAVLEDINYYAQSMNDGVQRFVKSVQALERAALTFPLKVYFCSDSQRAAAAFNLFAS